MTPEEPLPTPPSRLCELFAERFGALEDAGDGAAPGAPRLVFASAPGRVELAGNHTDHQGGRTISAAVDRRCYALAAPNGTRTAHLAMEGFGEASFNVDELEPREEERQSSTALARGMADGYVRAGGSLGGFDMAVCSDIPAGRSISSSAAFEMLVGVALHALFDPEGAPAFDKVALALDGSRTEQEYFGKMAGAQDQLASIHGGVSALNFAEPVPTATPIDFAPESLGCALVLVDSRCDHVRYTDDFSAISRDMRDAARLFGAERLIEVPYPTFLSSLGEVRGRLGDRAALRALHFYEETRRVERQTQALRDGDAARFLALVRQSGASSAQFLQNVSPRSDVEGKDQPMAIVLALCAHLLDGAGAPDGADESGEAAPDRQAGGVRGAYRIHGGGFGGAALAFVPNAQAESFVAEMDRLLGYDACMPVRLSAHGAQAQRLR